jgi:regulator of sigma E protease
MNLLPIPVLDGGHLALCLYEALAGRAPNPGMTVFLQRTGLTILLALMLSAVVADLFC